MGWLSCSDDKVLATIDKRRQDLSQAAEVAHRGRKLYSVYFFRKDGKLVDETEFWTQVSASANASWRRQLTEGNGFTYKVGFAGLDCDDVAQAYRL